ncbi:hypothetical protein BDV33DRAFT_180531 [Aspergillus novoparasiticus]|uniref:Uncharacterized protein n=1 Tax=Aspergillus novoparasiticus TaxID=986946 RepID=A0A5N6EDD6_9EURO|nr:hypothetical protein BDV33DRAFT_180531 [Aspergillus novoparasiticus]
MSCHFLSPPLTGAQMLSVLNLISMFPRLSVSYPAWSAFFAGFIGLSWHFKVWNPI